MTPPFQIISNALKEMAEETSKIRRRGRASAAMEAAVSMRDTTPPASAEGGTMTLCKDGCGAPAVAKGRCRACYNRHDRSAAVTKPLPGLMTPREASERRARLIREMRAEGYEHHEIAERFGGRTRAGERGEE